MSVPTIEIDLSAVTQPQPRTVGEVPVGHRFSYNGLEYMRIEPLWAHTSPMIPAVHMPTGNCADFNPAAAIEYLGPADGKAAAAGEEVTAKYCQPCDVVLYGQTLWEYIEHHGDNLHYFRGIQDKRIYALADNIVVRRIARLAFKTGANNG